MRFRRGERLRRRAGFRIRKFQKRLGQPLALSVYRLGPAPAPTASVPPGRERFAVPAPLPAPRRHEARVAWRLGPVRSKGRRVRGPVFLRRGRGATGRRDRPTQVREPCWRRRRLCAGLESPMRWKMRGKWRGVGQWSHRPAGRPSPMLRSLSGPMTAQKGRVKEALLGCRRDDASHRGDRRGSACRNDAVVGAQKT